MSPHFYDLIAHWRERIEADRGSTHWEGCEYVHHLCAMRRIFDALTAPTEPRTPRKASLPPEEP